MKTYQYISHFSNYYHDIVRVQRTTQAADPDDLCARVKAEGRGTVQWYTEVQGRPWGLVVAAMCTVVSGALILLSVPWLVAALAVVGCSLSVRHLQQLKVLSAQSEETLKVDQYRLRAAQVEAENNNVRLRLAQLEADNRAADAMMQCAEAL